MGVRRDIMQSDGRDWTVDIVPQDNDTMAPKCEDDYQLFSPDEVTHSHTTPLQ